MNIGGWLRSLGLEQYEAAFHANAVDADVLRDLTDQDLKKLGVLLGHRRKLSPAIAGLDGATCAGKRTAPHAIANPARGDISRRGCRSISRAPAGGGPLRFPFAPTIPYVQPGSPGRDDRRRSVFAEPRGTDVVAHRVRRSPR